MYWLDAVHRDSVTATFDIDCKMFVCSFIDKVRRMAVEVASAGHRVVQKCVLLLLNF